MVGCLRGVWEQRNLSEWYKGKLWGELTPAFTDEQLSPWFLTLIMDTVYNGNE